MAEKFNVILLWLVMLVHGNYFQCFPHTGIALSLFQTQPKIYSQLPLQLTSSLLTGAATTQHRSDVTTTTVPLVYYCLPILRTGAMLPKSAVLSRCNSTSYRYSNTSFKLDHFGNPNSFRWRSRSLCLYRLLLQQPREPRQPLST